LLIIGFHVQAQQTFVLRGQVVSDEKEMLMAVNIFAKESGTGTYSDSAGNFQLQLPAGAHTLLFSYIGFEAKQLTVYLQRDTTVSIVLKKSILLGEVTITERKKEVSLQQKESGEIVLHRANITALPSIMGEQDLVKAVQMLPGVQSGNEGIGGIFVRGGSPDQNLILLDGATVYNPSHLYGFISVFNSDVLSSVTLHKNAYPARYGGRLSSVLDIESKQGDTTSAKGSVGIGLISSRAHLEGPFRNKATTYNIAARGCYLGAISSPLSAMQFRSMGYEGFVRYFFYDVNGRIDHRFRNNKTSLAVNYFVNNDFYKLKTGDSYNTEEVQKKAGAIKGLSWVNMASSLHLTHKVNDKVKLMQSATYSRYLLKRTSESYNKEADNGNIYFAEEGRNQHVSVINNISLRSEALIMLNSKHTITAGVENAMRAFQIGRSEHYHIRNEGDTIEKENRPPLLLSNDISLYAEYNLKPAAWFTLNTGVRVTGYSHKGFFKVYPQYRANAIITPLDALNFRASFSTNVQTLHMLSSTSASMAVDYWVPATEGVQPQQSWQAAGGVFGKISKQVQWGIDGFYRSMSDLAEFKEGSDFEYAGVNWERHVAGGGKGESYGAEFLINKTGNKFTAQASYTLQWSNRQFDNINKGKTYPFRYDRRHNVALAVGYKLNKKWDFSVAWVYGSGNMFTMPTQSYQTLLSMEYSNMIAEQEGVAPDNAEVITAYSEQNSYRLPAYHHLDIGANYKWKKRKHEQVLNMSVYNVYSRQNIFSVYADYRYDDEGNGKIYLKQLSLFPILPSVTYTVFFSK
jgi:hypothetical protein